MSRTAIATIPRTARPAPFAPYQPPLAHRVHIATPYIPACATDVRATVERVQAQLAAITAGRRKPRRAAVQPIQQPDMFPSTVVCINAAQLQRAA